MEFSRRDFLRGASAVTGAYLLSSCGTEQLLPPVASPENPQNFTINEGATASAQAERGEQFQVTDTLPPPQSWHAGQFITHVDVDSKRMAFTFDDGPSPYNTHSVLDTLKRYGIPATFYLVGVNVQAWPDIVRRIVDEGHEVGNHSVYHSPYQALALANQIGPNQEIIYSASGVYPVTNRAPGLTRGQAILDACMQHGLYETHTNHGTNDWRAPRWQVDALYREFAGFDWTGDFALYHDGGNSRPTPQALPSMIELAISRGFTFHTATELVNSGVPRPSSMTYDALQRDDVVQNYQDGEEQPYVDVCNYDAKSELQTRLKDLNERPNAENLSERRRLEEIIAEVVELEKAD